MKKQAVVAIILTLVICAWPIGAAGAGRGFPKQIKEGTVCTITSNDVTVKGKVIKIDIKHGWIIVEEEGSRGTIYVRADNISFVRVE